MRERTKHFYSEKKVELRKVFICEDNRRRKVWHVVQGDTKHVFKNYFDACTKFRELAREQLVGVKQ